MLVSVQHSCHCILSEWHTHTLSLSLSLSLSVSLSLSHTHTHTHTHAHTHTQTRSSIQHRTWVSALDLLTLCTTRAAHHRTPAALSKHLYLLLQVLTSLFRQTKQQGVFRMEKAHQLRPEP